MSAANAFKQEQFEHVSPEVEGATLRDAIVSNGVEIMGQVLAMLPSLAPTTLAEKHSDPVPTEKPAPVTPIQRPQEAPPVKAPPFVPPAAEVYPSPAEQPVFTVPTAEELARKRREQVVPIPRPQPAPVPELQPSTPIEDDRPLAPIIPLYPEIEAAGTVRPPEQIAAEQQALSDINMIHLEQGDPTFDGGI